MLGAGHKSLPDVITLREFLVEVYCPVCRSDDHKRDWEKWRKQVLEPEEPEKAKPSLNFTRGQIGDTEYMAGITQTITTVCTLTLYTRTR